jgi:hypothetical protein
VGNTELADMINKSPARKEDKITVRPADIAQQKQAMKKAKPNAGPVTAKNGRRKGARRKAGRRRATTASTTAASTAQTQPATSATGGPVDVLDKVFELAKECGGFGALKRLVDRCAELTHR